MPEDSSRHRPEGQGSPPSYGGDSSLFMGITWSFVLLTAIFLAMRLYLRVKQRHMESEKQREWALWLAIFAWTFGLLANSMYSLCIYFGLGEPSPQLAMEYSIRFGKYLALGNVLCSLASAGAKASACAFLLAMQGITHKKGAWLLYFIAITNVIINVIYLFVLIFQCRMPSAAWDPTLKSDCSVREHAVLPLSILQPLWTALSDLILAMYPVFLIYSLHICRRVKSLICALMGLGVFATAVSFVRLYYFTRLSSVEAYYKYVAMIGFLNQLEMWLIVLALSIPPTWPLLKPYIIRSTSSFASKLNHYRPSVVKQSRDANAGSQQQYPERSSSSDKSRNWTGSYSEKLGTVDSRDNVDGTGKSRSREWPSSPDRTYHAV